MKYRTESSHDQLGFKTVRTLMAEEDIFMSSPVTLCIANALLHHHPDAGEFPFGEVSLSTIHPRAT